MSATLRHAHRALARTRSAGADHSVHRAPSPPYPRPPLPPVPYPALPHRSTHAWRELKALVEKVQHRHTSLTSVTIGDSVTSIEGVRRPSPAHSRPRR